MFTPARMRRSASIASAAVAPPLEWPKTPTRWRSSRPTPRSEPSREHEAHVARAQRDRLRPRHARGRRSSARARRRRGRRPGSRPARRCRRRRSRGSRGRRRGRSAAPSSRPARATSAGPDGARAAAGASAVAAAPRPSSAPGARPSAVLPGGLLGRGEHGGRRGAGRRGRVPDAERQAARAGVTRERLAAVVSVSVVRVKPTGAEPVVDGGDTGPRGRDEDRGGEESGGGGGIHGPSSLPAQAGRRDGVRRRRTVPDQAPAAVTRSERLQHVEPRRAAGGHGRRADARERRRSA